jgi:hypothetical protein
LDIVQVAVRGHILMIHRRAMEQRRCIDATEPSLRTTARRSSRGHARGIRYPT